MQKTILVTGANGFIGSHLSVKLVELGNTVIGIYRKNSSKNPVFNEYVKQKKIIPYLGDITSFDFFSLPKVDYIYHIAGKVSVWGKYEEFLKTNYEPTKRLLEFAKNSNVQCFTYFSSVAVYGFYGYKKLKETEEKKPFKNGYSLSKLKTEEMVESTCKSYEIDFVIIRPCNVYGEYDYTSSHEIYTRVKKEKMMICANGKYESCFVYAKNLVNASIIATENKKAHNTDYNIADGNETLNEVLTNIAKEFGTRPKFFNFPATLAKATASLVEGVYKIFRIKKAPLITKFSVYQNCNDYSFDTSKIESIGYKKEYSLEDGIKNTVKWINESEAK